MKRLTYTRGGPPSFMEGRVAYRTEPVTEEETAATGTTASTPSGGTSGSQEDQPTEQQLETPFRLEDIDDEAVREHVRRYTVQVQGAYTRKTQELARERDTLTPYRTLQERLESTDDAVRDEAVREVLRKAEWDFDDPNDLPPAAAGAPEATPTSTEPATPSQADTELAQRLAALETEQRQAKAEADEQRREKYLQEFQTRVNTGLDGHYAELKLDPEKDKAAVERERQAIVAYLGTLEPLEGDMPDIEGAITLRKADVAALTQAASTAYRESKDVPAVNTDGASGSPANTERRNDGGASRRQKALEVAGRHL
jgi:hypothetical protein